MKIILGSRSAGRKKILETMGFEFETMSADIDEKVFRSKDPVMLTVATACAKALALLSKIREEAVLITSDQIVFCHYRILEKPANEHEAREFLKLYAMHAAQTVTSVVAVNTCTGKSAIETDVATIWFRLIPDDVIEAYIATGIPLLCDGAFAYEHPLIAPYVRKIMGEPESIIGLPKKLTEELIRKVITK